MASTIGGCIPSLDFLFLVPNTDSFSVLLMELLTSINQSFLLSEKVEHLQIHGGYTFYVLTRSLG